MKGVFMFIMVVSVPKSESFNIYDLKFLQLLQSYIIGMILKISVSDWSFGRVQNPVRRDNNPSKC